MSLFCDRYAYQLGDKAKVEEVMKKFEEAIKNFPKCVECYVLYAQVMFLFYFRNGMLVQSLEFLLRRILLCVH